MSAVLETKGMECGLRWVEAACKEGVEAWGPLGEDEGEAERPRARGKPEAAEEVEEAGALKRGTEGWAEDAEEAEVGPSEAEQVMALSLSKKKKTSLACWLAAPE